MTAAEKAKSDIKEMARISYRVNLDEKDLEYILSISKSATALIDKNCPKRSTEVAKSCLSMIMSTILNEMRILHSV